jgi:hypothetical protein
MAQRAFLTRFALHRRPSTGDMMSTSFLISTVLAAGSGIVLAGCVAPVTADTHSIEPPSATRVMAATASGVQIYSCEFDAQRHLGWVFRNPQATLYDANGVAIIQHGAGPSWEADDGSRIVGHAIAQKPSETPGSVPQLLLATHSTGAPGALSSITYVQRVDTVGGAMPARPCSVEHQTGSSAYFARYVFYR